MRVSYGIFTPTQNTPGIPGKTSPTVNMCQNQSHSFVVPNSIKVEPAVEDVEIASVPACESWLVMLSLQFPFSFRDLGGACR